MIDLKSRCVRWRGPGPGVAFLAAWLGVLLVPSSRCASGEASKATAIDYQRDIKPLLSKRCYACHGALRQNAGLRLDTVASIRKGGDGGPGLIPGKSNESLIVEAVTGNEGWRMPPEGDGTPFSPEELRRLRSWIDQGAETPADDRPQTDPRDHWAYRPLSRPSVPRLSGARGDWVRNPIDAFLAANHQRRGLNPRPPAAPRELIRRVYLDLIGLVPLPEEARAFEADQSDRSYQAIVDRLLASPQYGERWGRHWMDVWRYSDWDGYGGEIRESQPHIWRWRDWIVESLNADCGYDRMIVQMLAADEDAPEDAKALRATGFLVRNWYKFNRNVWLDNTVEHTAKAFLGLTLNCARCHDHKYDPIAQSEYYSFRAFFEPHAARIDRLPGESDTKKRGLVRVYDSELDSKTFLFKRGDEKRPVQDRPLKAAIPRVLERQAALGSIQPVSLSATVYYPGLNRFVQEETLAQDRNELQAREGELIKAEKTLAEANDLEARNKARPAAELARKAVEAARASLVSAESRIAADRARYASPPHPEAASLAEAAAKAQHVAELHQAEEALLRADLHLAKAEQAAASGDAKAREKAHKALSEAKKDRDQARLDLKTRRQALSQKASGYASLGAVYPATSTGRRRALARWIADRKNPLTARVAINHIWMRHFGTPLVPTEFDFGLNGKPPSHPALLDWLAAELIDNEWRMKAIHRLIVTSSAYRMQSTPEGSSDPNLAIDPSNRDYWRMNTRRMEAEAVRDNLLRIAGNLDLTLGGPDLDPESGLTSTRRSLYFRHAKEKRVMFLRLFDSSNVLSCYRRNESVVPQQALALANSPLSFAQARRLAGVLSHEVGQNPSRATNDAFVAAAFERVLGRTPTSEEQLLCVNYLGDQARQLADRTKLTPFASAPGPSVPPSNDPTQRARESLVHALMNHNDFVSIR